MSNANPIEIYEIGLQLYEEINKTPFIDRATLNYKFRATNDNSKIQLISAALLHLLTLGYVKKHLDRDTSSMFFWSNTYSGKLPYMPDEVTNPVPHPIDIFGARPVHRTEPEEQPMPTKAEKTVEGLVQPTVSAVAASEDYKDRYHRLKGDMQRFFMCFMENPTRLFNAKDQCFVDMIDKPTLRGMTLGKLWKFKHVRRAVDIADSNIAYYTLDGVFPPSLREVRPDDDETKQKLALRKQEREERRRRELEASTTHEQEEHSQQSPADTAEETEDSEVLEEDTFGDDHSEEDESTQTNEPLALMDQRQEFQFIRGDGTVLVFDEEESRAWRQLILNINIERLKD